MNTTVANCKLNAIAITSAIPLDIELDSYSIAEFCRRNSISRSTFYNLKGDGDGPRETRARGRVLISKESAQAWRERAIQ
jgi:hypothetical protein